MDKYSVRQKRMSLNMTLSDLQVKCRLDTAFLSRMENGKYIPSSDEKRRIAKALSCTEDELLFPELKTAYGV